MNIGIGGMGGLQIGEEDRRLGIGTTIGMAMRMVIALATDVDEGGQVTVRDRKAESLPLESYLAIPVPVWDLNRPYNLLPRWTDILKSPLTLGLTMRLPRSLRLLF
jgi:hypothetical protein